MAKQDIKTIVFPEASFSDAVIKAAKFLAGKKICKVILIGDESAFFVKYNNLESPFLKIINPKTSELTAEVAKKILQLRAHKGIDAEQALSLAQQPYYFACGLVVLNYADGIVSGTESAASATYRPALEIIKGKTPNAVMSSGALFIGENLGRKQAFLLADCALLQNPTEDQLVCVAKRCVDLWKTIFLQEPKVAFVSYSTNQSAQGGTVQKMQNAAKKFLAKFPEVVSDGEMQLDCALSAKAQAKKWQNCKIKGDANIIIVPNIGVGNAVAHTIGQLTSLEMIGPIGLGFARPVCILNADASVSEIVALSAIAAIQAQDD